MGIYIGAVKTSAFMKKFGSNVSIQGSLQTLRVDIVDSEQSSSKKKNAKGKQHKGRKFPKFSIDMGEQSPHLTLKLNIICELTKITTTLGHVLFQAWRHLHSYAKVSR